MYNTQLETFIITAEEGSFLKASEKLYISPSGIIKHINSLEERIGFDLFARTHRGLYLTEEGKEFLKEAKYIIEYSENAVNRIKNIKNKGKNTVRVGVSPMTPEKDLIKLWSEIEQLNKKFKLELIPFENTPKKAVEILKNLGDNIF